MILSLDTCAQGPRTGKWFALKHVDPQEHKGQENAVFVAPEDAGADRA